MFAHHGRRWVCASAGAMLFASACGGATESVGAGGNAGTGIDASGVTGGNAGTGGSAGAGGSTGGSAGADGGTCPSAEPTIGSSCAPAGHLNCFYGDDPCCGGSYTCGADGKWQTLGLGCACMPHDSGSDARATDAPSDARIDCGGASCAPDQFCVHPSTNLCGPAPQCVPRDDAGACPPGTMFDAFCLGSSSGGCVEIPMRGAPHCETVATTCDASSPSCSCLARNACDTNGADVCQRIEGRDLYCICLAP
jgi:hypothetical protein